MSRNLMRYPTEELFNTLLTSYVHRAEEAAIIRARADNIYIADLDEWLWYTHPACRARIDRFFAEFLRPGDDTEEFLKRRLANIARNPCGFSENMIMGKIAYHRTAIRNLDRSIARAEHTAARPHVSTQRIGLQPQSELETMIKYRDIHRWCVSMLHAAIVSHASVRWNHP